MKAPHLTDEYTREIQEASKNIYRWYKSRLPDGHKNDEWYSELFNELTSILKPYRGKESEGYAVRYGIACLDELERLEIGKPMQPTEVKRLGRMDVDGLVAYLSKNPRKGEFATVEINGKSVIVEIKNVED